MRVFREAPWLTSDRANAYGRTIGVVAAVFLAVWIAFGAVHGGMDPFGKPLGPDFAPYYAAAKLAWIGDAPSAYDPRIHYAEEQSIFGGAQLPGPTPFLYPPVFLLICLPFAALPYLVSLLVWTGLTGGAFWASVRAIWPKMGSGLPILVFPGLLTNVLNGQNGLLSGALFAAACCALGRHPMLAGVCYGCLAYKPQLALAVPFALLIFRRWSTIGAALMTAIVIAASSSAVFGFAAWESFFRASRLARRLLEGGLAMPERMTSVFAAAQSWHASLPVAYAMQAVVAVAVIAGLVVVRRTEGGPAQGAVIAASASLVSPYMFDYDLAIAAVPMAWLMSQARSKEGFWPWEKLVLCAAFVSPVIARGVATVVGLPLAPAVSLMLYFAVIRRLRNERTRPGALLTV